MKISMGGLDVGLNLAVEQAVDAIMTTDPSGVIQYVNAAFERVSGFSRGEVIGRHVRLLKSGKHDAAFYRHLWETLSRGQAWTGTFVNRRKDGRLYEEATVISPVRDDAGELVGYLAVKRDVTDERKQERKTRYLQRLEALSRLAGGVAHDVNNSLMTIMGNVEVLESRLPETGEVGEGMAEIKAACERAVSLARQLLAFGRPQPSQPALLDVNLVVGGLEKMLRRVLGEDLSLRIIRHARPALVRFEAARLEQLLLYLSVRAREVLPAGGAFTVTVSEIEPAPPADAAGGTATDDGWIELRVADTGACLETDALAELLESTDSAQSRPVGAGRTFADTTEMIRRSGGCFSVDCGPAGGASFTVRLPRAAPARPQLTSLPRHAEEMRGSETVLVAEDEDGVRDLVRGGLTRLGYRVLDAVDGPGALHRAGLHRGPIHVLITDMVMPGMSGCELAARVLALHPQARIIYMSGYPHEPLGDQEVAKPAAFLQKPFTRDVLARTVRAVLERR